MIKRWKTRKQKGGNKITIDAYKDLLSVFVHSDAKHDFNSYYIKNKSYITGSIPKSNNLNKTLSEDELLSSININNLENTSSTSTFTLQNIIDIYNDTDGILEVEFKFHDNIQRNYMIYVVHYQDNKTLLAEPDNFLMYFGGMRSFIMDYSLIKFFNGFKNNNNTSLYNIDNPYYIIYNREMENDPANKPMLKSKHFDMKGYYLEKVDDIDTNIIYYPKWNNYNLFYNTMFYSNYDIYLTNKPTQLGINNILYDTSNNSIKQLVSLYNTKEYDIAFQRKRSGDTLQVLSVFDNNRKLSNMKAHYNPKMLITHDRLCLYYSLLMGVDVGFTNIKYINGTQYHLITFINQSEKYDNKFDYKNNQKGGRTTFKNIKFKYNKTRRNKVSTILKTINKMNYNNIDISFLFYHKYIKWINQILNYENICNPTIKISNILKMNIENNDIIYYNNNISIISNKTISYEDNIKNAIKYYDKTNKDYANYIRSLSCIIWIIKLYEDILINNRTFNTYNPKKLKELLTRELTEELKEKIENCGNKWGVSERDNLQAIYQYMKYDDENNEYTYLYEQFCHSCDWNLEDLSQIIYYVYNNNLDIYNTLLMIAGDYSYSMYSIKPPQPGLQSTAGEILGDLDYDYKHNLEHTKEVDILINNINTIKSGLYLKDFKQSLDVLLKLFRREFDKYLIWGANGLF